MEHSFHAFHMEDRTHLIGDGPEAVELERRIVAGDDSLRTQTAGRALQDYRIVERLGAPLDDPLGHSIAPASVEVVEGRARADSQPVAPALGSTAGGVVDQGLQASRQRPEDGDLVNGA